MLRRDSNSISLPDLGSTLHRAFGHGRTSFVAKLALDAAVFAGLACAIVFAVSRQDPDVQAAAAPPAGRVPLPAWYASARRTETSTLPTAGWPIARPGHRAPAVTKRG